MVVCSLRIFYILNEKLASHSHIVLVIIKLVHSSVKRPVGTHAARGLGSSKESCQRHKGLVGSYAARGLEQLKASRQRHKGLVGAYAT